MFDSGLEHPTLLRTSEGLTLSRWHDRLHGHEFEQTLGESEGQGSLACCSPWDSKELDMTEQLNNKKICSIPLQGMK